MYIDAGRSVFSPSDLSAFLSCRHRIGLDLAMAHGEIPEPTWSDPLGQALRERGLAHELAYVEWLRAQGLVVEDVSKGDDRDARTRDALQRGVDVIYQARLSFDGWRGYADVLLRVDKPSALGAWSYEVHDTKLARETRGGTVLQLAVYSELLERLQGLRPEHFHVVSPARQQDASSGGAPSEPGPASRFAVQAYRLDDFAAYFRRIRQELLHTVQRGHDEIRDAHYPEPVDVCEMCRWWQRCHARRRQDDHLSFIAGIGRTHRAELESHGFATLEAAATLPQPLPFTPTRGSRETYYRLHHQARVQHRQRVEGSPVHELLEPQPGLGLARLPEPSPGDLFLDLEGAPYAREGGREYLFGLWSARGYESWWAIDDAQEQAAFEALVDRITTQWAETPGMHVYHFAPYEPSALKRLMGRYATRGDELDRLLRGERLVDLLAVVRQGLRAGVESYSIKQLEQYYGFVRDVQLGIAGEERTALELALERGVVDGVSAETRDAVEVYNRDDCRSTEALRDWLERLRTGAIADGAVIDRPTEKPAAAPAEVGELEAKQLAARARLLEGLPVEAAQPTHPDHPRWLLAYLLDWHRREEKVAWWEHFRLAALAPDDLVEEPSGVTGLQFVERVSVVLNKRTQKPTGSVVDRYRYPSQETEVGRGAVKLPGGEPFGEVVDGDRSARTLDIKKGKGTAEEHPTALFQVDVFGTKEMQESLLRLTGQVNAQVCGMDLLHRRPPRLASGPLEALPGEATVDQARRIALALDHTTLAVQGPPGAGKTYLGAQMIRALVATGKRVGVVASSHKVIRNLLEAVHQQAREAEEAVRIGHRCDPSDGDDPAPAIREYDKNPDAHEALRIAEVQVFGGTAWLWAREEFANAVDVLFVDEAGQMSLATALAVSPAASSLVLLGDPQQLEQPQKGSHPDGVDVSALQHVLGDHQTMPPEKGLFLAETWRLAPAVCAFTSELFYEGKLRARDGLQQQVLTGCDGLNGAGLWWHPVPHDGNRNWSAEEIDAVSAVVDRLLAPGVGWVNAKGQALPLTGTDILVVAPYNAHVNRLSERLSSRGVRVGTVDKFQGQEAPVVIYAMGSSTPSDAPRGMDFLYSLNRLNVATSRARCAAIVVASPRLLEPECRTPEQMMLANALCRFVEMASRISG